MHDRSIYTFALQHLERRRDELNGLIANVHSQTGTRTAKAIEPDSSVPDWVLSASERAAQKPEPEAPKKRTMSPAGRARLIAALKLRWAKVKAAKALGKKKA